MKRTGRDDLPERGEERAPSRAQRAEDPEKPLRYGPGIGFYLGAVFLLLFGGGAIYFGLLAVDGSALISGSAMIAAGLFLLLVARIRYRVSDEGIEVRKPGKRAQWWSWSEIGGLYGARIDPLGMGGLQSDRVNPGTSRVVTDHEGRVLFRVSPWTAKRRELAKHIRKRAAAAARQEE